MEIADAGSKDFDVDDWMIDTPNFMEINKVWGHFTVDLFASSSNARVKKFFTRKPEEGSAGVNAFSQILWGEHVWACPPPNLIQPAIKLLSRFGVTGVLCVPLWQASTFWPALCPDGSRLARFVVDYLIFHPTFVAGPDVSSKTFQGTAKFRMAALKCNFAIPRGETSHTNGYFKIV